jgi:hypothetical protein
MRAPCLVALLAPTLAFAQVAPTPPVGHITWPTVPHTDTDGYVNIAECAAGTIDLTWLTSVTVAGQLPTAYRLYASDQAPAGDCYTANTTVGGTAVNAGLVGAIDSTRTGQMTATFATSVMVAAAGATCDDANGTSVYLCIQEVNGGTTLGVARLGADGNPARLAVSFDRPAAPVDVVARPADGAAVVSWSDGGGAVASDTYVVDAWLGLTPTAAPLVSSPRVTGTSYRLRGLINGQPWSVRVRAFSAAGNANLDPSPLTSVRPKATPPDPIQAAPAGGGCGGPAGPGALLALLGALGLAGRRRA